VFSFSGIRISPGYSAFTGALRDILEVEMDLDNITLVDDIRLAEDDGVATITIGDDSFEIFGKKKRGKMRLYSPRLSTDIRLGDIKAIYRNLRENYEYRLRYDEAGKFFIREMEIKRNHREVRVSPGKYAIKRNGWFRRNLFSLTGLYYHLSRYGSILCILLGLLAQTRQPCCIRRVCKKILQY
jgi:hypothetical protein